VVGRTQCCYDAAMARFAFVAVGWWLLASQANPELDSFPILTVCEALDKAAEYDGKVVIVVGTATGTSEGSWIGEDCPGELVIDGRKWGYAISTGYLDDGEDPPPPLPKGFRWDKQALREKLRGVKKTRHRWAVYGRLEAKTTRVEVREALRITSTGYGHQGSAPAQLVWPERGWRRLR
jgi:hypothetical protein